YFYISLLCTFLIGFIINSLYQATVPHVQDLGMGADFSAIILSVFMVTIAVSKFLVGFLNDRIGFVKTYMLCMGCAMAASILFVTMKSREAAAVYAIVQGFCLPLETVLIPLTVSQLFGNKDFASIFGLYTAFSSAGIAAGNPLFNLAYDLWGSYTHAALIYAGLLGIIIVSMAFVFRLAKRERTDYAAKYGEVSELRS
ncbi:MAG: MFS transporter, partial [Clostridiales bacterium]|nr:MFS transporter [Clostridiales bacterium]